MPAIPRKLPASPAWIPTPPRTLQGPERRRRRIRKSTVGRKILVDVLARRDMAVVLDIGGDMLAFCRAKAPPGTPISSLDGYAVDGDAPNVAELLATETDRQRCAAKLLPDVKGDPNPFFIKSTERLQVPPGHPGPLCARHASRSGT